MSEVSNILRRIAEAIDLSDITEDDLDRVKFALMELLDAKMNYEQAKRFTGKSDAAFNAKISRSGIKVYKERLYKYSDMLRIRNKQI